MLRNHKQILSEFMTYRRVSNKSNTMGATGGTGTADPSGAHAFPSFLGGFFFGGGGVHVVQSLIFCEVPCRSLFVFLSFSIGNCFVCTSAIYGFLPTLLLIIHLFSSTDCTARYLYNYHKHLSV